MTPVGLQCETFFAFSGYLGVLYRHFYLTFQLPLSQGPSDDSQPAPNRPVFSELKNNFSQTDDAKPTGTELVRILAAATNQRYQADQPLVSLHPSLEQICSIDIFIEFFPIGAQGLSSNSSHRNAVAQTLAIQQVPRIPFSQSLLGALNVSFRDRPIIQTNQTWARGASLCHRIVFLFLNLKTQARHYDLLKCNVFRWNQNALLSRIQ